MNTRKASLRKLRLPGATTNKSRNGRQKNAATISNYFSCEEDAEGLSKTVQMTLYSTATPSTIAENDEEAALQEETQSQHIENHAELANDLEATTYSGQMPSPIEAEDQDANKLKRALRTKLSTFLPKEKRVKIGKRSTNDFEKPNKTVKKAPKAKSKASSKKQQNIKSALLKHEQLFSEVTAQHCLADNVNPDEMQMAIALSRSELEISMSAEEVQDDDKPNEKNEGIRDKLKKFGFRVAESEDYNLTAFMPTKRKTKWANKFTPLTLRNQQRQLIKVNQRIENLLSSQFSSEDLQPVDDYTTYSLKSRVLTRFLSKDHHVVRTNVSGSETLLDFYVLSLFEPSRTKAGHLLKDVGLIAGRDTTPKKAALAPQDAESEALFQSPAMKKSRCDKEISSSCPPLTRNLLDVFDCVSTQPEHIKESSFSETHVEALREITSISLNTMGNKNENDKPASACENNCKASITAFSNDINNECLNVSAEVRMSTGAQTVSSPVRCTSPDIFADSDSDIATDECADMGSKLNASKSSSSDHHITTYEVFSSDEVKTSSITRKDSNIMLSPTPVIDLTQCGSDSNTQPSPKDVQNVEEDKESISNSFYTALINLDECEEIAFEPSKSMERSLHQSLQNSIGFSFGSSQSEDFDKSNSMKTKASEISIDLTQNEDDEDDCIMLSDDEVNYSIWQANKTEHIEEHQPNDNISINHASCSREENEFENREFSFIDLAAGSQPLPATQSEEFHNGVHLESNTFLDLELGLDHSMRTEFQQSPFKTPTKTPKTSPRTTPTSKSPSGQKLLSEWLIPSQETTPKHCSGMQSTSEDEQALFKTPTKTPKNNPRKTSTSASPKCRKVLSDSFKTSPTNRGNTSGRSSSANSLHDHSQLDLDYSKRSEFGILDEQSPFKTPTKTPRKTPRKTPDSESPRCRKKLSDSYIQSPGERVPPIKRFSSLTSFKESTKTDDDDDNLSDLDEIDKLIYGSPSKRAYKKPAGLDQLLTGPINAQTDSPQKPEPASPQKSEPDSPKEFSFNGRTYLVRSSNVSQMLDYEKMDEPALLNQLYKYGIRRLKRKQAIKVLEYIYKQTHPCLVDANESPTQSKQVRSEDEDVLDEDNFTNAHPIAEASKGFKFNLKDCWGHLLVSNADIQMEIKDEQYIFQTNTSKKISTVFLPFHIAWYNLVKSNKLLHEAILHYEPIDLQEVYMFLKSLGYRYEPKELKYFFDSRSIIFRYDLNKTDPSAASKRHTRKRPHKSTQRKGMTKRS